MTGKTHYRLGIIYYFIFSSLPMLVSLPLLTANNRISLASIGVAVFGALIVDSDTQKSLINKVNPITAGTNGVILKIENIIKKALRFLIGMLAGFLILNNMAFITQKFGESDRTYIIAYTTAFICAFAGIANDKFIRKIPIISIVYSICTHTVRRLLNTIKRFTIIVIYISIAAGITIYNINNGNEAILYIAAIILLGTAIFPHRTFLHAIEGVILYALLAKYIANRFGYPHLGNAFFVGYFSHVYLADILTNRGIPISVIPTILKKTGIHARFKKFFIYRVTVEFLDTKLSIPIMKTGTTSGNIFEFFYCTILLIAAVILVVNNYGALSFGII